MVKFFKLLILSSLVTLSACMRTAPIIEPDQTASITQIEDTSALEPTAVEAEASPAETSNAILPEAEEPKNPAIIMINPQTISGAWRLNVGGELCQIFTTHTKLNQGFRASTRLCPPPLSEVRSWQIKENQLNLLNNANEIIVSLVLKAPESEDSPVNSLNFVGTLANGTNITLSR